MKASPPDLVLTNGLLIDGTGAAPVRWAAIVVRNGRIHAAGAGIELPQDAEVIDLQGRTILPGFFNCHVHRALKADVLRQWAHEGVTTVRDLGANLRMDQFALRGRLRQYNRNAHLVMVGPMISTLRGYGTLKIGSPAEARAAVHRLAGAGADLVKVGIEDHLQSRPYKLIPIEQLRALVEAAHACSLRVAAHVTRAHHLELAIEAGVDDVAHMIINDLPDELIEKMLERDIYWVPTLELWSGVGRRYKLDWDVRAIANLGRFVLAGGKVATGTDYAGHAVPFDLGMPITEMKLMQQAGMTNMQIILAGTRNAARVCGLPDHGTLEPGRNADVLVVEGDPLGSLDALKHPFLVVHNGERIR